MGYPRDVSDQKTFTQTFLEETQAIAAALPQDTIERMATGLAAVRERGGRLFAIGVGGGAGHASHAVNDFRKLCGLETYSPSDNVSELTARTNDEGWDTSYSEWLRTSRLKAEDALLIFSVGGGSRDPEVSMNIVLAVELAKERGADVFGIVGRAQGVTAQQATEVVVVDAPAARLTPHVEAFQAVVWHLLISHPALSTATAKWEGVTGK
jgi:D-sedoheptulose 7-phosphate isomerase